MGWITESADNAIGFVKTSARDYKKRTEIYESANPSKSKLSAQAIRKNTKTDEAYSDAYATKQLGRATYSKEALKATKAEARRVSKAKLRSSFGNVVPSRKAFTGQLKQLGAEVNRYSQGYNPQLEEMRRREMIRRAEMAGPKNFFEHDDPINVYGDDEIAFFDSQKKSRTQRRTGSFFGI